MEVRIERKPSFLVTGKKCWVSGQDTEIFGDFWEESHKNGLVQRLKEMAGKQGGTVTGSQVLGVSCVEKDPACRAFDFFIAAEAGDSLPPQDLESYAVPECLWAIFSNRGAPPRALVEAEMYAMLEWLPASPYRHAHGPELEVYPLEDSRRVEFWLPLEVK